MVNFHEVMFHVWVVRQAMDVLSHFANGMYFSEVEISKVSTLNCVVPKIGDRTDLV